MRGVPLRSFRSPALGAVLAGGLALASCVRNPASGKLELDLISQSQEIEMGRQGAAEVEQSIGTYKDPKLEAYVARIGQSLSQRTNRKDLPWQFHIADDAAVNAFALPGGPVFVTRGLLGTLTSEAQLAAVVGHECGHIAARHSANQISKAELAKVGLGVGSILSPQIASLGQVAGVGLSLLFLKFSRDDESQADQLGFAYMTNEGYDARQMIDLFRTLSAISKAGGGGKLPEWLATHPDPENREKETEQRLAEHPLDYASFKLNRDEYLSMLEGLPYGEDPRQGYFEGARFLHPGLKFQLTFPEGWKTQNAPQEVAGVSPKKDAVVELAPAGTLPPEQAATKFFAQQGVKQGRAAAVRVNGLPAVAAYFAAQTQQGTIAGLVAFAAHGGLTYGMLGYTGAQSLSTYDAAFQAFVQSFAPLTDPAKLAVEPPRIHLVRIDAPMTLAEFDRRYPSNLRLEELGLINEVPDANARLEAGRRVKRVEGGPPAKQRTEHPQ